MASSVKRLHTGSGIRLPLRFLLAFLLPFDCRDSFGLRAVCPRMRVPVRRLCWLVVYDL
jgi:hypothetical protein